jgi:HD-GYP domain-containing protein (c-di-GMP phosphodiesterase class II)
MSSSDPVTARSEQSIAPPGGPWPIEQVPVSLAPARRIDMLAYLSGAFDFAEGQSRGHACRVAHLGLSIARELGFDAQRRRTILNVALLHDSGIAVRDPRGDASRGDETDGGHERAGAWVAERFGIGDDVQTAIRSTHERWDGKGRPNGLAMTEIPVESLVIAAAHWASAAAEAVENPLRARAELQQLNPDEVEPQVGRDVATALAAVLRDDTTWAALWDAKLPRIVADAGAGEGKASVARVEAAAAAMGEVIDASANRPGRSAAVAAVTTELAGRLGFSASHGRAIRVAARLLDIGQLGVPKHVIDKPDILSIEEMEQVRRHPSLGARLLEDAPGLEHVASWIEAHHERPDGRGYPEMLQTGDIPLSAALLSAADAYCALRTDRPYRPALSHEDAMAVIVDGAGAQFDERVAAELSAAVMACGVTFPPEQARRGA